MHAKTLLDSFAPAMLDGEHSFLADFFVYPLPVRVGHLRDQVNTPEAMAGHLARLTEWLKASGVTSIRTRIVAEGFPCDAGTPYWIDWQGVDAGGHVLHQIRLHTVLSYLPDVEMPQIERIAHNAPLLARLSQPVIAAA